MSLDRDKLAKLLALASSPVEQEALSALRRANAMLGTAGMSFTDIAQMIRPARVQAGRAPHSPTSSIVARFILSLVDPSADMPGAENRIQRRTDALIDIGCIFSAGILLGTVFTLLTRHW